MNFEYLGEDVVFPGSKFYHVEAIHVTTTGNRRKFTEAELKEAGRSLSFRPININHDESKTLKYPQNATVEMHYNSVKKVVEGRLRIADKEIQKRMEAGEFPHVSIEQIPTRGESCNEILCEQHGVAFIGIALLETGVAPGDPNAHPSRKPEYVLSESIVPDKQRECKECTDFKACCNCTGNHPESTGQWLNADGTSSLSSS